MKLLKVTTEQRAYTEEQAKDIINKIRADAQEKGYTIGAAGYTYTEKKKKGQVVAQAWVVKTVAIYEPVWDEGEGEQ